MEDVLTNEDLTVRLTAARVRKETALAIRHEFKAEAEQTRKELRSGSRITKLKRMVAKADTYKDIARAIKYVAIYNMRNYIDPAMSNSLNLLLIQRRIVLDRERSAGEGVVGDAMLLSAEEVELVLNHRRKAAATESSGQVIDDLRPTN